MARARHRRRPPCLKVVAAVMRDRRGRILLALRPARLDHGGLWEFPGGKLHRGERPIDGLARELFEELGVEIDHGIPLVRVRHAYAENTVLLDVWEISTWRHAPLGKEGQRIAWVDPRELHNYRFPAADQPVMGACRLPRVLLITPDPGDDTDGFIARLAACLAEGVACVQLRAPGYAAARYRELAARVLAVCRTFHATLILNGEPADVEAIGADGVHLPAAALRRHRHRPLGPRFIVSAACHDLDELQRAERLGVDVALVSPVHRTASHPGAPPLGWRRLRALAGRTRLPVYALGGLQVEDLPRAIAAGCLGVAMLSGVWSVAQPLPFAARLAAALGRCCQEVAAT